LVHEVQAAAAAGTIAERFEQVVRRQPGSTALRFRGRAVSYAELNSSAARLAGWLADRGVPPGSRVGVCLERGPAAIAAILATLRAACAYVPLDPDFPRARLAAMAGVSAISAVIADKANGARIGADLRDCMVIDVADPAAHHPREWGARLLARRHPQPRDIAYIACTSGSSSGPKPVAVSHAQVLGMYEAWERVYRLAEVTRHLQMAALGFDVFTGDLLRALLSGGTLVISPKEATLDPGALYDLLRSEQIECAEFVPATFRPLMRYVASIGATLGFMRTIIVGSDRWTAQDYRAACQLAGPGAEIVNSYGKTEAAVDSTALLSRDWVPVGDGTVPIGRPLPGVEAYVVGAGLELVAYGQVGELAIGGVGVSYGYPNDPRLTASMFRPDPFSGRPGARLHMTGDLARWGPAGLMLAGRSDEQVKIRGVRIEPGEVEAALSSHPAVRDAAVVAIPGPASEPMLVGYVTPSTVNPAAVRSHVARHLAPVAVPAVVAVDSLPVTANGKVDRHALAGRALPARRPVAPHADPVTRQVAAIWCEILGESAVHAEDDFYMIGGNSLLGAQVAVKLRAAFRIRVSLWVTEKNRTLGELAGWVREELKRRQDAPRRAADDLVAAAAAADVVVTGGTGGVGSFIVRALARRGYAVAAAGREESADAAAAAGAASFVPVDLADTARLTDLARHANAVIHAAWMFADPDGSVAATIALLAGWSAGPFTLISTTDVYDPDPGPYAAAKAACERALAAAAGDRPWTALRPGYVWGPHERFASQLRWADLRWLVEPLLQGAAVYVPGPDPAGARRYGDGWIGVRDLAAAAAASLEQPARRPVDAVAGHFTWLGLARTLAAELGSASRVVLRDPAADPHATRWRCDPGQLPALLGVTPQHRRYRQALREVISHAAGGTLAAAANTGPLPPTGDARDWQAVVNGEGQFSVWPAGRPLPAGWHDSGINGSRADCLDRIAEIWPDSLPRGARRPAAVAVRECRPDPGQPTAARRGRT
jgi:amino acid adenylation domain-containing protein